jgi:uncharacterized protein YodC (DUF2158 family)
MANENVFNVGDVVSLKSNSTPLTVWQIDGMYCSCIYWDSTNYKFVEHSIHSGALKKNTN